jgi:hypothetical protein
VQAELERLESEEEQLKRSLSDLAKRQAPVERVSDDARSFLESWEDVGELLEAATPEERLQILQHYIEVAEVGLIDPQTRTGTYAMRLFPQVAPPRLRLRQRRQRTKRQTEPSPPARTAPFLLTPEGLVRTAVQKAPPVGLEFTLSALRPQWT